jgi:hypothetical protein
MGGVGVDVLHGFFGVADALFGVFVWVGTQNVLLPAVRPYTYFVWSHLMAAIIFAAFPFPSTYDHRILKTRLPVRSALFKQDTGGLVVRWVTTSESPLLYVFAILFALFFAPLFSFNVLIALISTV